MPDDGRMDALEQQRGSTALRTAIVVRPAEDSCEVFSGDGPGVVSYSTAFKPRAQGLTPGHLLAVTDGAEGSQVVWRWYDAVVLELPGEQVRLWEPAHGEVLANPRDAQRRYQPGSRAYLSAGLPGAEGWLAGPVAPAGHAAVELDEVAAFYTRHDLWSLG